MLVIGLTIQRSCLLVELMEIYIRNKCERCFSYTELLFIKYRSKIILV